MGGRALGFLKGSGESGGGSRLNVQNTEPDVFNTVWGF